MNSAESAAPRRDLWDKIQVAAIAAGAVALPVVIAIIGNAFSSSMKEKEIRLKTVEIAVNVLSQDPRSNTELPYLREWAVDVIDRYSGTPLGAQAREELLRNALPAATSVADLLHKSFDDGGGGFFVESHVDSFKFMDGTFDMTSSTRNATVERPIIGRAGIHSFKVFVGDREFEIAVPLERGRLTKVVINQSGVSVGEPMEVEEVLRN